MKKTLSEYLIETYGENAIELYWSDKNTLTPYDYSCGSKKQVWFKCVEKAYHEDYFMRVNHFTNNHRCAYCVGQKTHPKDSFAQWGIDNICEDFLEKYWGDTNTLNPYFLSKKSTKIAMFKCTKKDYHKEYSMSIVDFTIGNRCPYCTNKRVNKKDSLGEKFPYSKIIFSDKNEKSVYELAPYSHKKIWWKCENGIHEDYQRTISKNVEVGFKCPTCSTQNTESSLEKTIKIFLKELKYNIACEYDCSIIPKNPKNKHGLPFDIEVVDINLIIEIHGGQHYNLFSDNTKWIGYLTPHQYLHKRKLYDRYKKFIAHINGYNYLEIPYWEFDENDTYKQTILNKIEQIIKE